MNPQKELLWGLWVEPFECGIASLGLWRIGSRPLGVSGFRARVCEDYRKASGLTVNPIKLETGLRPNSAGIPYTLPRFPSSPLIIRVPFFLLFGFNKGTQKEKG